VSRRERQVDVLVVGGGPAGLSIATELARLGAGAVEVVEREEQAGGIPRHSAHVGYGLRDLHRVTTGPGYARRLVESAIGAGVSVRTGVTATDWAGARTLDATGPDGLERIAARAVVLATGARERPRPARLVPGSRPDGVLTTGLLQQLVHLHDAPVGRSAVVVGAEHVSWSAALTLQEAGARVVAMVTDLPRQQSYPAFRVAALLRWGFPLLTGTTVTRLVGRPRLSGVEVRHADGRVAVLPADTVVFTGDWVPDHELARRGGLVIDRGTRGPAVDTALRTSAAGVFAVGNLVHPVETADVAALRARATAALVVEHLAASTTDVPAAVTVQGGGPIAWVAPNRVAPDGPAPPGGRFALWPRAFVVAPATLEVRQGERLLHREPRPRGLVPNRTVHLAAEWTPRVDAAGGPVTVTAR
jgi:thioredoxin reductase